MAVVAAVVVHKQLGIYVYGCGIKQASGFLQLVSPCHLGFCFTGSSVLSQNSAEGL